MRSFDRGIFTKKYLLSVKNKYKIPIEETALTEHQLESYMAEMKKLQEAGDWNKGS
jgi:hypothetical protein